MLSYFLPFGKAGGLQIPRCQGFAVAHYSFTLSALNLKPSDFCNVRVKTEALLYLVPLVAFVFDLYIMGEDYGIKRAGVFIKTSPAAPPEERLWEQELKSKRDLFSRAATPLASLLILVACTVVIARSKISLLPFTPWLIISALLVALTHTKCAFRNSRLKAFETWLTQAAMQNERRKQMQTPATH